MAQGERGDDCRLPPSRDPGAERDRRRESLVGDHAPERFRAPSAEHDEHFSRRQQPLRKRLRDLAAADDEPERGAALADASIGRAAVGGLGLLGHG